MNYMDTLPVVSLLKNGKHKAFRKAQDVVRKKYRQRNTNYGHTNASEYYWASFILID